MQNNQKDKNSFVCRDCFKLKECKDPLISWLFFVLALIAVIAIRAVNVFMGTNPLLAKVLW
jgi:hypothetical protein